MAVVFCKPQACPRMYVWPRCSPCSISPLLFFIGLHALLLFPWLLLFAARLFVTVVTIASFATVVASLMSDMLAEHIPAHKDSASAKADGRPSSATSPCPSTAANAYTINLAVPGIKKADLSVTTTDGTVHIKGETKVVGETSAARVYKIDKMISLPDDANMDQAEAKHENGLLTLSVPKINAVPRPIPIQSSIAGTAAKETQAMAPTIPSAAPSVAPDGEAAGSAAPSVAPDGESFAGSADGWDDEWDTLLDELSEMGFDDRDRGREALAKHSGSIKKAVKELVVARAGSPPVHKAPQP